MDKKLLKKAEKLRDELWPAPKRQHHYSQPVKRGNILPDIGFAPFIRHEGVFIFIQAIFPRIFVALLPDRPYNFSLSPMRDARKISGRGFG